MRGGRIGKLVRIQDKLGYGGEIGVSWLVAENELRVSAEGGACIRQLTRRDSDNWMTSSLVR